MRKESLGTSIIVILIISLTLITVNITSPTGPIVSVDPPTISKLVGSTFDINITVTNVTASPYLYGWQFNVTFNASVLEAISVEEGPFLQQAGDTTFLTPTIDNTLPTGSAFAGCSIMPNETTGELPPEGASGNGTIAIITFQALSEGNTALHFDETKLNTVDIWGNPVPIGHTSTDGTVTVTPSHDVAVVSVTAPVEAASSSLVPINATVKNEGSYEEETNVTIRHDSTYINSQNVTLAKGASQTVSFTWNTTGVTKGTYTVNATATIPVDDDPTDNYKTTTIRIVEHDVAVTDVDAPSMAKVGATVSINVTIENQGSNTEEANVTIRHDSTYINSQNKTLASGTSTNASFTWDTSGLAEGTYTVNATATIPVDDDPTDNYKTTTIQLKLFHDVNVTSIEAPQYAPAGTMVSINVTVKNEGDFAEEANVTISYFTTYIDSQNVTLNPGENDTALFNWNTAGLPADYYTVKALATIPVDDEPVDNFLQTLVILTVHDVAVVNITARSVAYFDFNASIIVTVKNEGSFIEKANLTLKYDGILIGNETVTLVTGESLDVLFTLNTTGISYGNYTLNATATVLESTDNPGGIDDDPGDNILDDVTIVVTIPGDIDGDGDVDPDDFYVFSGTYGSSVGDPAYIPEADIDGDGDVDPDDFYIFSGKYGSSI